MSYLVSPNAGLWVWMVGWVVLVVILVVRVPVLWIRDRRPPRMTLGWLGSLVLLHIVPILGIAGLLSMLAESLHAFVVSHTSRA